MARSSSWINIETKVVIVDIWGDTVRALPQEIPELVKLQRVHGSQGFQIIGVNYEKTEKTEEAIAAIRKFRATARMNYPSVIGDSQTKDQIPDFHGYPTTLFIDRSGQVRILACLAVDVLLAPEIFCKHCLPRNKTDSRESRNSEVARSSNYSNSIFTQLGNYPAAWWRFRCESAWCRVGVDATIRRSAIIADLKREAGQ